MPFALITIGLLVMISAVRNTLPQLAAALKKDFSGSNNFFYWVAGIGAVGALGYIPAARTFSRIFLALIIIVLALRNGGFFSQFMSALQSIQAPPAATTNSSTGTTDPSGGSTSAQGTGSSSTTSQNPALSDPVGNTINDIYNGMGLPALSGNILPDLGTLFGGS